MPFIQQQLSADGVASEGRVVATKAILEAILNDHIESLDAVAAGGTGYAVGDTFRLSAGTPVIVSGDSFHATGRVVAESAGVVTEVIIYSSGAYTALPGTTGIATVTLTGAGNDGLTVDLTTATALWTLDDEDYTDLLTQTEWLCTSVKASNAPVIGMRSQLVSTNDGIRITMGDSYSGILPWDEQPGHPPTDTFYMAVPNQDPILYLSTTERRVNVMITDGTSKQYAGAGLFIPNIDVVANYPFPGMIHGQSTSVQPFNEVFSGDNRGIVNPIDFSGLGCYQYRNNLSTEWYGITRDNNNGVDVCRAQIWPAQGNWADWSLQFAPVPTGSSALATHMEPKNSLNQVMCFQENGYYAENVPTAEGPQGPQPLGVGGQLHFTTQAHIISNQTNDVQVIGVIDGFEAIHMLGLTSFDEIINADGRRYTVFNDTSSANLWQGVAMEMI